MYIHQDASRKYYLVHAGPLKDKLAVHNTLNVAANEDAFALAEKYGTQKFYRDEKQCVKGLVFEGKPHAEFKPQNRFGFSMPKPGTAAEQRINVLPRTSTSSQLILDELGPVNLIHIAYGDQTDAAVVVGHNSIPAMSYGVNAGIIGLFIPDVEKAAKSLPAWANVTLSFPELQLPAELEEITAQQYVSIMNHKNWADSPVKLVEEGGPYIYRATFAEYDKNVLIDTTVLQESERTELLNRELRNVLRSLILQHAESKTLPTSVLSKDGVYPEGITAVRPWFLE